MPHQIRRSWRVGLLIVGVVSSLWAQDERDKAREAALRELQNLSETKTSNDALERSKSKWDQYSQEIEAGIADQQKFQAASAAELQTQLVLYQNRAKVQETPVARYLYGRILGLVDRVEEAKAEFEAVIRQDPYFPWAYHGLGTCFARSEHYEEAIRVYRRAIELNPKLTRTLEPLAACLMKFERYDEAEAVLRKLFEANPNDPQAWVTMGKLQIVRTNYAEGAKCFKRAFDLDPRLDETRRLLAYCYRKNSQYAESVTLYESILKANPKDVAAGIGLAEVKFMMGRNHEAADALEAAVKYMPDDDKSLPEIKQRIAQLRAQPATEKRDPRQKTPQECIDILMNSTEEARCLDAIRALSTWPQFDEDIYKSFVRAVRNKYPKVRILAIREMGRRWEGQLNSLTPVLVLVVANDKEDRDVRAMAANVLGQSRDDAAVPALIKAIATREPYLFSEVHEALLALTPAHISPITPSPLDQASMDEIARSWNEWYEQNHDRYRRYEQKEPK